ncbi:ketopantoate reductase family protein [Carboxylicivirga sp. M1479]|uniref:ketopantoate reductase family protein n=1 Tax=Carboxylicivirga sp. M1479 TaxID=2594476 RepID=UPI001178414F|nr:2-dehydropantoate 2-reductase [Carboxylicivirga sp. M1479]TRX60404.1 2-dehydropantoate 2-reductase [Carboxylicivirga sp. M1479]
MKIAVIGTGGVGGYFGAKLAQAGNDVTFVARGAHLKAIQDNGLHVKSILGDLHIANVQVTDLITDIAKVDLVITAVKAWQVKEIRNDIKQIIHSESIVLPLQNGVLAAKELCEVIPPANVMGGLCRIFSLIEKPGVINHVGYKPEIVFGELNGSLSLRMKNLGHLFDEAGISNKASTDIEADMWKKFIFICTSGLLAVTKTTYGELRELKETRSMMIDLLKEIYAVSQKAGVRIKPEIIDKTIAVIDSVAYDSTSSLTRDVWEGKPSEIDYQNGTVVKLAEQLGVDVPVNQFIYNCILPSELKVRG